MTPFGVIIGYAFSGLSEVIRAICMSISAGTFLYIGGTEIIVEEFGLTCYRWKKFLILLVGIFFIIVLKSLECSGILEDA